MPRGLGFSGACGKIDHSWRARLANRASIAVQFAWRGSDNRERTTRRPIVAALAAGAIAGVDGSQNNNPPPNAPYGRPSQQAEQTRVTGKLV